MEHRLLYGARVMVVINFNRFSNDTHVCTALALCCVVDLAEFFNISDEIRYTAFRTFLPWFCPPEIEIVGEKNKIAKCEIELNTLMLSPKRTNARLQYIKQKVE